ncbi:MBL fold metallo-hydrolase, partial [Shewanella sp. SG41-4]|uniref:MBL fold metallo-hydrolase n=1 Tax=Shewanella sp. SG41-4 TaxID=2760976 RepID=UPI001602179C
MLTSSERTFFTNAYIVETKNAVVVVDTMMINSDALGLKQYIEEIGKTLLAIIITHGHPDHYNGCNVLISTFGEIPIISTKGVRECIENTVDSKEVKWKPYFGKEWPETRWLPNQIVSDRDELFFDGLEYKFRDLGAAESQSDLYFTIGVNRPVIFLGDVVFNSMLGFTNDGNSRLWLQVLDQLLIEVGDVKRLFTCHGMPGKSFDHIKAQIEYLSNYRDILSSMLLEKKGV